MLRRTPSRSNRFEPSSGFSSSTHNMATTTRTPPNSTRTPPLNPGFRVRALTPDKLLKKGKLVVQIPCFPHLSLANLKDIFRMLKIYVENNHSLLTTPEKHSSWPSKRLLLVLLVHRLGHLAGATSKSSDVYS